jgi:hypothetical protein
MRTAGLLTSTARYPAAMIVLALTLEQLDRIASLGVFKSLGLYVEFTFDEISLFHYSSLITAAGQTVYTHHPASQGVSSSIQLPA